MCVAVPMQIRSLNGNKGVLISQGVVTEADLSLIEGLQPGDYVLVHAGFAITRLRPEEAQETLALFRELEGEKGDETKMPGDK
ncbi:MAG: HypC/HybG/HupF family hydrogenase formation chaperone [Bacteroidota bacterium]